MARDGKRTERVLRDPFGAFRGRGTAAEDDGWAREVARRVRRFGRNRSSWGEQLAKPAEDGLGTVRREEPGTEATVRQIREEYRNRRPVDGWPVDGRTDYIVRDGVAVKATDPAGGERLAAARKARGWSLDDLSRRSMVSWRRLYDAEVHGARLGDEGRRAVAAELGVEGASLP